MSPTAYISQLHPLSERTVAKVEKLFQEVSLKKSEYYLKEGETARHLGFLQEGLLRGYYRHEDGTEYNKHFFLAPCLIGGYASLITGKPNQINQQALTDCRLLTADYGEFTALYNTCPDLERAARKWAELSFVEKEEREIDIVLLDADERYRIFQKQLGHLEQLIPQYHIASYLGITPTQLSRIRSKK
jgi:CRP-like cAMP-binding protein